MVKFALILYNLLFPFAFLVYFPLYLHKLIRRGGSAKGFRERFGIIGADKKARLRQLNNPIWIHAVSVGEVQLAIPFINYWLEREPNRHFVLSTTTSTGQAIARSKAPDKVVPIYCPIDWYPCIAATLRSVCPAAVLIVEVEIWPTLITMVSDRGVPIGLINGRVSDRTARRQMKFRRLFKDLFTRLSMIAVQAEDDVGRIKDIVGDHRALRACSTMKFDIVPDPDTSFDETVLDSVFGTEPRVVFIAASIWPGEGEIIARLYRELAALYPVLRMIVVPRHAERGDEFKAVLESQALAAHLLTDLRADPKSEIRNPKSETPPVLLANTTGELMSLLTVSDIVFVGKSLGGNHEGQNIIEPATLGKAVLFGAGMSNFRDVVKIFKAADAVVEVADERELTAAVRRLLDSPADRAALGGRARQAVVDSRGAMAQTIDLFDTHCSTAP
jgi:3-deoxy-D-manno-octulosonic-acid transferase